VQNNHRWPVAGRQCEWKSLSEKPKNLWNKYTLEFIIKAEFCNKQNDLNIVEFTNKIPFTLQSFNWRNVEVI